MPGLSHIHTYLPHLLAPTHPYLPFGLIDSFGAARSSLIIDWIASGVFDPPAPEHEVRSKTKKKKIATKTRSRATLSQELFGSMIVLFGGETFLCLCTGQTPSWLVNPNVALLFGGIHVLQTRTPIRRSSPSKPTLGLELLLSLPDAIGRTLSLTKFSVLPLLHASSSVLPKTPTTLLLTPFIVAVPFASIAFSTFNSFSPEPKFQTPLESREYGWAYADTWLPVVVPVSSSSSIGPVEGWRFGWGWSEEEALVLCTAFVWIVFAGKAVYHLGNRREQWLEMFRISGKKIKTA